jgi:dolichol kinase
LSTTTLPKPAADLAEALPSIATDLRQLAAKLSRPQLSDLRWVAAMRDKQRELAERITVLRSQCGSQFEQLGAHLESRRVALAETLAQLSTDLQTGARELANRAAKPGAAAGALRELGSTLTRRYEDLVEQVKALEIWRPAAEAELRALRLPRPMRSLLHVFTGLGVVLLYQVVSRGTALWILAGFATTFAGLEISRRFSKRWNDLMVDKIFGLIVRPRERYQTNSATFYLFAMLAIFWFAPHPAVCLALLVLAFGDPAASFIGARWGRIRLYNDKSLLGSAVFFAAGSIVSTIYLALAVAPMSPLRMIAIATSVSAVGTVVELFSDRLDDNFTIPVTCAAMAMLWF